MAGPIINTSISSGGLPAGISWGDTRSSGAGVGLTHNIGANAAVGVQGLKTVLDNTQTNALVANFIELGSSALGHIGLYINARGNSDSQRGVRVDTERGTGFLVVDYEDTNNDAGGFVYTNGQTNKQGGVAFKAVVSTIRNFNARSTDIQLIATLDQAGRTIEANRFISDRTSASAITDNYDAFYIKKSLTKNGSGSTFNNAGAALKVENNIVRSFGVLNDTSHAIEIVQSADAGGFPLDITQSAVVSDNFKKIINAAGFTVWVSDGTTAEGALPGVEGDICLNGGTGAGQTAYCDADGTNWTDM
jgi:hypothetical protein